MFVYAHMFNAGCLGTFNNNQDSKEVLLTGKNMGSDIHSMYIYYI